jgi:predicted LPLAT superfamily acyltransferase
MTTILVVGAAIISLIALVETRTNMRLADGARSHLLLWAITGMLIFSAMLSSYMQRALAPSQNSARTACVVGDRDDLVRAALGPLHGHAVFLCAPEDSSPRS